MSQEKVTRYKEAKANRKEMIKKEKRTKLIRAWVGGVIGVALIGWIGYSAVVTGINSIPRDSVEVDYTAFTDYQTELTAEAE